MMTDKEMTRFTTIEIDDKGEFLGRFLFFARAKVFVNIDPDSPRCIENVGLIGAMGVIVSTDDNDYDITGDVAYCAVARWMETHDDEVVELAAAALEDGSE